MHPWDVRGAAIGSNPGSCKAMGISRALRLPSGRKMSGVICLASSRRLGAFPDGLSTLPDRSSHRRAGEPDMAMCPYPSREPRRVRRLPPSLRSVARPVRVRVGKEGSTGGQDGVVANCECSWRSARSAAWTGHGSVSGRQCWRWRS